MEDLKLTIEEKRAQLAQVERIQANQARTTMTFQSTKYNCEKCKDTTWVADGARMKRCGCYQKDLIARRWKRFGVDPSQVKMIRDYKVDTKEKEFARAKAANYIREFDSIATKRNNSIAFLGQPGAGKTHLSLGIGKALLEREKHVEVVYMPYLEVMQELKSNAMDEIAYVKIQSKYTTSKLLIIDDLFKDKVKKGCLCGKLTEADMKHIYPIINQRYNNQLPTIYSSECSANMLLDLDEALGGRIIESCEENLIIFKYCKENNYRLKNI